jgi:uncharacterized membrane protein YeaQ/YmgE (transglycosylase-associated protein family)
MKGILAMIGGIVAMGLLFSVIGGFLVIRFARKFVPGKNRIGWGMTILILFLGGIFGKLLFFLLHIPTQGRIVGFISWIVGAFVLLLIYNAWLSFKERRA